MTYFSTAIPNLSLNSTNKKHFQAKNTATIKKAVRNVREKLNESKHLLLSKLSYRKITYTDLKKIELILHLIVRFLINTCEN